MRNLHRLGLLAVAGVVAATVALAAMAATARVAATPSNTAPPTISGNTGEGSELTANNGTWSGGGTMTFTYQWRRCDANGAGCCGHLRRDPADLSAEVGRQRQHAARRRHGEERRRHGLGDHRPDRGDQGCGAARSDRLPEWCSRLHGRSRRRQLAGSASDRPVPVEPEGDPGQHAVLHDARSCGRHVRADGQRRAGLCDRSAVQPVDIPAQVTTGSDGWATLQFNRRHGFPAATKQRLMVMFVRASKPGDPVLAGFSTRRRVAAGQPQGLRIVDTSLRGGRTASPQRAGVTTRGRLGREPMAGPQPAWVRRRDVSERQTAVLDTPSSLWRIRGSTGRGVEQQRRGRRESPARPLPRVRPARCQRSSAGRRGCACRHRFARRGPLVVRVGCGDARGRGSFRLLRSRTDAINAGAPQGDSCLGETGSSLGELRSCEGHVGDSPPDRAPGTAP